MGPAARRGSHTADSGSPEPTALRPLTATLKVSEIRRYAFARAQRFDVRAARGRAFCASLPVPGSVTFCYRSWPLTSHE
jgi:hypothetical protein